MAFVVEAGDSEVAKEGESGEVGGRAVVVGIRGVVDVKVVDPGIPLLGELEGARLEARELRKAFQGGGAQADVTRDVPVENE